VFENLSELLRELIEFRFAQFQPREFGDLGDVLTTKRGH
jgi:hypothetical protein